MRSLRNFEETDSISDDINLTQLSCFIYIRDCIAHNPNILLLPEGNNTNSFIQTVSKGRFNFATIESREITIFDNSIHQLHLTIRKFYGRPPAFT